MMDTGEYIRKKTERLFEEWGYNFEMTLRRCRFDKALFLEHVRHVNREGEDDFILSKVDLDFYNHIYEKSGIKTLIMLYEDKYVYYNFLTNITIEEPVTEKDKTRYVMKGQFKRINLESRDPYGKQMGNKHKKDDWNKDKTTECKQSLEREEVQDSGL